MGIDIVGDALLVSGLFLFSRILIWSLVWTILLSCFVEATEEVRHYRDEDERLAAKKRSREEERVSVVAKKEEKEEEESASDAVKRFLKDDWPQMKKEDEKRAKEEKRIEDFEEFLKEEVASEFQKEKEEVAFKKEPQTAHVGLRPSLHPHEREWKRVKPEVVSSSDEEPDELAQTRREIAETEMALAVAVKTEAAGGDSPDDDAQ